ncbi:MAG TPA: bifunctional oligoribonuclease/PAP phosphatase NrnA [Dictyoglomaceae bacterium]|nr:bifunctional oligoribonuclease/PAP phosphatase NrnA [Dictyoglomaceae bacterium]HOL39809.1 bifunctional oligoribonuclease/PAP phosphatase NrnA [Dictyoglomaceae bacterium]HOP95310.1 bifunctional oligoribonuclease/PAP phosphatase NrnA [Dictyoglomaceae bacterium]HPP16224.1 bifunctional oligoribonuclease/PAP phosphatase NrnA [Dictyoglomaceae bacterium]HPU42950.1 bifunctional oligoribonuclease/PAP phosphatase NrnA [Dictyoglomaceae bacterium]
MKTLSKRKILKFKELIKDKSTFVLFTHANPDGDAIGSLLAFYYFLRDLGKEVFVFLHSPIPYFYQFLLTEELNKIENIDTHFDVGIILDCSDLERIKSGVNLKERFSTLVNIDHHPTNTSFGDLNIVIPTASSVTEIIYDLIVGLRGKITKIIAESLLTGLITDTGSFKYSNTTPKSLKIAGELVNKGADITYISKEIYDKKKLSSLKLLGTALLRLESSENICWSYITLEDMKKYNATIEDTEGIIDILRTLREAEVCIFFYPITEGGIKVSLRSKKKEIDLGKFALIFGGGGHKEAAGFQMEGHLDEVLKIVTSKIRDFIEEYEQLPVNK